MMEITPGIALRMVSLHLLLVDFWAVAFSLAVCCSFIEAIFFRSFLFFFLSLRILFACFFRCFFISQRWSHEPSAGFWLVLAVEAVSVVSGKSVNIEAITMLLLSHERHMVSRRLWERRQGSPPCSQWLLLNFSRNL